MTGGGTGGHIYPALAIISAVRERVPGVEVLYVGSRRGMEAELVPRSGIEFVSLDVTGLARKAPRQVLDGMMRAGRALARARGLVREFRPSVAVGTGGYVSGPVILAAVLARVPVVLQEQNAVPGATNRWLSRWARAVCVPFEDTVAHFPRRARVVVTGNPVRRELLEPGRLEAARSLNLRPDLPILLSTGGSQGAASIVRATVALITSGRLPPGTQVVFATGTRYYDQAMAGLKDAGIEPASTGNIILRPYLHDMYLAMAAAHLAVSRAGAMTVSELAARGLPAILVPSPHVAHNEQEHNARVLAKAGAGIMVTESEDVPARVIQAAVELLSDPARLQAMSRRCQGLGRPGAAGHIAGLVLDQARRG